MKAMRHSQNGRRALEQLGIVGAASIQRQVQAFQHVNAYQKDPEKYIKHNGKEKAEAIQRFIDKRNSDSRDDGNTLGAEKRAAQGS